jgi:hypothetical protein
MELLQQFICYVIGLPVSYSFCGPHLHRAVRVLSPNLEVVKEATQRADYD